MCAKGRDILRIVFHAILVVAIVAETAVMVIAIVVTLNLRLQKREEAVIHAESVGGVERIHGIAQQLCESREFVVLAIILPAFQHFVAIRFEHLFGDSLSSILVNVLKELTQSLCSVVRRFVGEELLKLSMDVLAVSHD
jgi:hypothetical protein